MDMQGKFQLAIGDSVGTWSSLNVIECAPTVVWCPKDSQSRKYRSPMSKKSFGSDSNSGMCSVPGNHMSSPFSLVWIFLVFFVPLKSSPVAFDDLV